MVTPSIGAIEYTQLIYAEPVFYSPRYKPMGGAWIANIQLERKYPWFSVAYEGDQSPHSLGVQFPLFMELVQNQGVQEWSTEQWRQIIVTANFLVDKWTGQGHYAHSVGQADAIMKPMTKGQITVYDRIVKHVTLSLRQQAKAHLS